MIFVTVGSQMPFDRLISTIDEWVGQQDGREVFAQIGDSDYRPMHMSWTRFLDPDAFQDQLNAADVIVGHAGTGTILEALRIGKPVVILPRRGHLRETRDDHQLATVEAFAETKGVYVANTVEELQRHLSCIGTLVTEPSTSHHASERLLSALRAFVSPNP